MLASLPSLAPSLVVMIVFCAVTHWAATFTAQHKGVVVGFGEMVVGCGMENGPVAESVATIDLPPASRRQLEFSDDFAVRG